MTGNLRQRRRARNPNQLDLFEWSPHIPARRQLPSLAERHFRQRGYPPSTAALLASLAGLKTEDD